MIPTSTLRLRDLILAEAKARGVPLKQRFLRLERGLPVLHVRLGDRALRGCHVGLPGDPNVADFGHAPDVITVHGSGNRTSRMWPRKLDGTFNISAVTGHLLALVKQEISRPQPDLDVPVGIPASASGLHVVHLAGVRLGALALRSKAESLLPRIETGKVRDRFQRHLQRGGLIDSDMRALGDGAGLYLGRSNKRDDRDPFEPLSDRILTALVLGKQMGNKVERRYVLILDQRGDEIELADPAGQGLTTVTPSELEKAWMLGAVRGRAWLGTISAK